MLWCPCSWRMGLRLFGFRTVCGSASTGSPVPEPNCADQPQSRCNLVRCRGAQGQSKGITIHGAGGAGRPTVRVKHSSLQPQPTCSLAAFRILQTMASKIFQAAQSVSKLQSATSNFWLGLLRMSGSRRSRYSLHGGNATNSLGPAEHRGFIGTSIS